MDERDAFLERAKRSGGGIVPVIRQVVTDADTPVAAFAKIARPPFAFLLESLVGSFREIARLWARKYRYPMAGEECEELPLVAQYIAVDQGEETFVRDEFADALRAGILRQYPEISQEIASGPVLSAKLSCGQPARSSMDK